MSGTLYIIGTPIGNMEDITLRQLRMLEEVDFICAEDTRVTLKLLNRYEIKKQLVSFHEHSTAAEAEQIIGRLISGENCGVVTDAGMPCISDPGEVLVKLCAEKGIDVKVVPGPSAVVSAVALSAMGAKRFMFEGFLPVPKKERAERLELLRGETGLMVFYEAPHKLVSTLEDMMEVFGGSRKISLCRELTKLNEDIMRTTLQNANEYYKQNSPRGEYVLVVEGTEEAGCIATVENELLSLTPREHVEKYIADGMSKMDAIKKTAKDRGVPKSEIYDLMID